MNALHSSKSAEWYTPAPIVEAARQLMGGIDLDPASCEQANEVVQATRFYTAADDGLKQPWSGKVFLNPPGGRGQVKAFWSKLTEHWRNREVEQAIWIGYSLEQLQTLQGCMPWSPLDFSICVPKRRISFESPGRTPKSPTHANYIAFIPPHRAEMSGAFVHAFRPFGRCRL